MFRFRKEPKPAAPPPTLYKEALIDRIHQATACDKQIIADVLATLTTAIEDALAQGHQVTLIDFGTFYTHTYPAGQLRAIRSGAVMRYPAARRPAFRAGNLLRRAVRDRR